MGHWQNKNGSWEWDAEAIVVTVHQHPERPGAWAVTCRQINVFWRVMPAATSADEAKAMGLDYVRSTLRRMVDHLG